MAEIGFADIENSILRYRKYLVVNKNNTLMKKSKTQKTRTMVEIKKWQSLIWNWILYTTEIKSKQAKI